MERITEWILGTAKDGLVRMVARRVAIAVFIALSTFVIVSAVRAQFSEQLSLRDQIIINTQRLNRIERNLDQINDSNVSRSVALLENKINSLEQRLDQQQSLLYNALIFAIAQFMALVIMGVRAWVNWLSQRADRQDLNRNHSE